MSTEIEKKEVRAGAETDAQTSARSSNPVEGQYAPGMDLSSVNYTSLNPFYPNYYGQCTWYAWGRTREAMIANITFSSTTGRSGGRWYDLVTNAKRKTSTPAVGERGVIVWDHDDGGHVAFMEKYDGTYVWFSESNANKDGQVNTVKKKTLADTKKYCNGQSNGRFVGFLIFNDYAS